MVTLNPFGQQRPVISGSTQANPNFQRTASLGGTHGSGVRSPLCSLVSLGGQGTPNRACPLMR